MNPSSGKGREASNALAVRQTFDSDDAPPVPLAQLDANMLHQEKTALPSTTGTQVTVFREDALRQGEPASPGRDDYSTTPVVHESQGSNIVEGRRSDEEAADMVRATATLVENEEMVVAMARVVHFYEDKKWRIFALAMCILLTGSAVFLSLALTDVVSIKEDEVAAVEVVQEAPVSSETPSLSPSSAPTFDPRPTLEIVQDRGHIVCGMDARAVNEGVGYALGFCRAIAAVVVGNPDSYIGVQVSFANRWQHLLERKIDVLIRYDTYTIEREVKETSTGVGFTFSSVYNYDGMVYFGDETFVKCAEERKRYHECSSLLIGAVPTTTHVEFLKKVFPSDNIAVGSSVATLEEIQDMLLNGTCNVIAWDLTGQLDFAATIDPSDGRNFTMGTQMKTKEPLAMATRKDDHEWSDVVNWVLQALFFGEQQGVVKDFAFCDDYGNYTELAFHDVSDLNFMNAVYCVGNFGEIFGGSPETRGMNQVNNGTGMLYAIPFGNFDKENIMVPPSGSTMAKIRKDGVLNCGIVTQDQPKGRSVNQGLSRMGADYCRTLAAALLNGDPEHVNFFHYEESELKAYLALQKGQVDVLIGGIIKPKFDFKRSPGRGFYFSTPYYYENEDSSDDSFYSIVTRQDDHLFASFTNCIVLATIYAQENGIGSENSWEMPPASIFGSGSDWALRDAILYSGGYGQIYEKNFNGSVSEASLGRNTLTKGGPMMHSLSSTLP